MSDPDRTKLTFSQAEGIDPLPQPAALGELSQQARVSLWNIIYGRLDAAARREVGLFGKAYIIGAVENDSASLPHIPLTQTGRRV